MILQSQAFHGQMRRFLVVVSVLAACIGNSSRANAQVFEQINGPPGPGPFFWVPADIGWYWTPESDVCLASIQTQLRRDFGNLNNNFTFTTTLYTDRPAVGGVALASADWNGATFVDGEWLGGNFEPPVQLTGGTTYFIGMSGWSQALGWAGPNSGAGVNWVGEPVGPPTENLGAGSTHSSSAENPGSFDIQFSEDLIVTDQPVLRFVETAQVFEQVNGPPGPGAFFWVPADIGWYWTPASDVCLTSIQTQLRRDFGNLNNNFTFTTTLFTDRPAVGGVEIASFDWNGTDFVAGEWLGGNFDSPVELTGGTEYFIGMSGWAQALGWAGPNSGAGVNWVGEPVGPPTENLGAGSTHSSSAENPGSFDIQFSEDLIVTDQPVLRFLQTNECVLVGDINDDGVVSLLDVAPFVALISSGGFNPAADINCDGLVNLLDVAPFVELLSGG